MVFGNAIIFPQHIIYTEIFADLVWLAGDKEDGLLLGIQLHGGVHHHWLILDVQHTLVVQILILNVHTTDSEVHTL